MTKSVPVLPEVLPSHIISAAVDVVSMASMVLVCAVIERNPVRWRNELSELTAELLGDGARWRAFEDALQAQAGCPEWALEHARRSLPWRRFGAGYGAGEVETEIQVLAWAPGTGAPDALEPAVEEILERCVMGIVDLLILCRPEDISAGRNVHTALGALVDCVRPARRIEARVVDALEAWVAYHVDGAGIDDREFVRLWRASRDWSSGA